MALEGIVSVIPAQIPQLPLCVRRTLPCLLLLFAQAKGDFPLCACECMQRSEREVWRESRGRQKNSTPISASDCCEGAVSGREGGDQRRENAFAAAEQGSGMQGKGMLKRAQIDTEREWRAPVATRRPRLCYCCCCCWHARECSERVRTLSWQSASVSFGWSRCEAEDGQSGEMDSRGGEAKMDGRSTWHRVRRSSISSSCQLCPNCASTQKKKEQRGQTRGWMADSSSVEREERENALTRMMMTAGGAEEGAQRRAWLLLLERAPMRNRCAVLLRA